MVGNLRRGLFFDRDGVLNVPVDLPGGKTRAPWSEVEFTLFAEAGEAVRCAHEAGFIPVVITNQPDIARGTLSLAAADHLNGLLRALLPEVAGIYVCPHSGDEGCVCRKPKPGMLIDAAEDLRINLASSWLIGDRWVDIAAAAAAGCRSVLIRNGQSWQPTGAGAPLAGLTPTLESEDVLDAVRQVMRSS